jgi:hypothetical protein
MPTPKTTCVVLYDAVVFEALLLLACCKHPSTCQQLEVRMNTHGEQATSTSNSNNSQSEDAIHELESWEFLENIAAVYEYAQSKQFTVEYKHVQHSHITHSSSSLFACTSAATMATVKRSKPLLNSTDCNMHMHYMLLSVNSPQETKYTELISTKAVEVSLSVVGNSSTCSTNSTKQWHK